MAESRAARMVLAALAIASACGGPRPTAPAAPPPAQVAPARLTPLAQKNLASFDQVWQTVKDKHWDQARVGPAWDAARRELRPRVAAARSVDEARTVLVELLARLEQSHFAIIPGEAYADVAQPAPSPDAPAAVKAPERAGADDETGDEADEPESDAPTGEACRAGDLGLDARIVDGAAVVNRVEPRGPAASAGVRPGWVIERVDAVDVAELMERVRRSSPDARTAPIEAVQRLSAGCAGRRARVRLRAPLERIVSLRIARAAPAGREVQFGNLPSMQLSYRARRMGRDVGYIALSVFLDAEVVLADFARDMEKFARTRGLVLDLRGNPGGIGLMAMGMGSWFVTGHIRTLGTMRTRDAALKLILTPRPQPYAGKLAILVDELSMSTSEILAGGLQDLKRARVFGVRTPGAALPSAIERLPNGDGFQYAFASYVSADGEALEGKGVVPDVEVPLTREALLAGEDAALEAALDWIRSK
ncbi:MAG TPA: S41 family peptidase [Kofleriaceae bacterium]|nr:S41 family peptidase [Kofleriaceae bacterium]